MSAEEGWIETSSSGDLLDNLPNERNFKRLVGGRIAEEGRIGRGGIRNGEEH